VKVVFTCVEPIEYNEALDGILLVFDGLA